MYSASSERQQPRRAQQNQLQCQRPLWRQRTRQLEQAQHQQHQCCSVQLQQKNGHTIQQRFLFRIRPCLVSFMFLNRFKRVFQRFPNSACTMGPQFISNVYIQGGGASCVLTCLCYVYVVFMLCLCCCPLSAACFTCENMCFWGAANYGEAWTCPLCGKQCQIGQKARHLKKHEIA